MGRDVETKTFTREQRQRYREKVQRCLDVFEQMLVAHSFEFDEPLTGMEIELNLADADYRPKMDNAGVLDAIADPEYQTELGRFNIEFNVPPGPLAGDALARLEESLRASMNAAESRSNALGTHIVMTGILPTVMSETFEGDWMSENIRYAAINDAVLAARGEDIHIDIEGPGGESLTCYVDSVAPESACTSMQLHVQVRPEEFSDHWNAAQVLAGPQLALAANSPFLMGSRLWAETRIVLFAQSTDTRPIEYANQGVRPRVWFGERWITSIFDLFEENARWFPALLPELEDEDPQQVLANGGVPQLSEMRLHNGTIYRWNRPIYDVSDGMPHLRLENRVLPAGPTVVDVLANAAFYYGTLRALAYEERPVWSRMAFSTAHANFLEGSRQGIDANLFWPGKGELPASELILRHLLPLAYEGLDAWGTAPEVRDRLLGIVEGRCKTGVNGAEWQSLAVARLEASGMGRPEALRRMVAAYAERMHSNIPVHLWEMP